MSDDEGHTSFRSAHFRDYLSATLQGVPIEQVLLDYFSTSPFYDRTCNNEVCAMQNRARCSEDLKWGDMFLQNFWDQVTDHRIIEKWREFNMK